MLRLLIVVVCSWLSPVEEVATDHGCNVVDISGFDRNHDGRIDRVEERSRSRRCEEGIVPYA
ncbi:MAG TPA: hypothetical protein QGF58_09060 [Myxococcota bacterium]|nr:hypothetical protein [Myxococcota bacterium]